MTAHTPTSRRTPTSESCDECGFDGDQVSPADAAVALRSFGRRYSAPLSRFLPGEDGDDLIRQRPSPATWSALEYAAHVRDVIALLSWGLHQTLISDHPHFADVIDPDAAAVSGGYNQLDPATVAAELAANAERMAAKVEGVAASDWERPADLADIPTTAVGLVRHTVHEGSHHLLDIGRVLRAVREQGPSGPLSGKQGPSGPLSGKQGPSGQ